MHRGAASYQQRVETLFLSNPWVWIDWHRLAQVGGGAAWRTRVSDARRKFEQSSLGAIDNRVVRHEDWTQSEYRFSPR